MSVVFLAFIGGLAVGAWLTHRHHCRASSMPNPPTAAPVERDATDLQAINAWQQSIKLAPLGDDMTALRLRMKLRREEERQRPEEGRN